jgi:hypothetical protein
MRMKIYDDKAKQETLGRLENWALWSLTGGMPNLDPPAFVELMSEYFPSNWQNIAYDMDAQHIEDTVTNLNITGRQWGGWGDVYRLILKQEYLEPGRPLEVRTENVKRCFKFTTYSQRSYERHWHLAKMSVFLWAEPLCKK